MRRKLTLTNNTNITYFVAEPCKGNQFTCDDGTCIPYHWRCDLRPDCPDGTDELRCPEVLPVNHGCPGEFKCTQTDRCVPRAWLCDGEDDCRYGEDEHPVQCGWPPQCPWNTALCEGTMECVPLAKFCDGHADCPNRLVFHLMVFLACVCNQEIGFTLMQRLQINVLSFLLISILCLLMISNRSDEWNFCNETMCDNHHCGYACMPTPGGPNCYCPDGQKISHDKRTCEEANECELDFTCSQICENTVGSFECSCVSGYQKNGTDCMAINGEICF